MVPGGSIIMRDIYLTGGSMGLLSGLFGKDKNKGGAPEMKERGEGFWKNTETFTLRNAGFDQLEPLIQAEGARFVAMGASVRFHPNSGQILFLKRDLWTAELTKTEEAGGVCHWKVSFRDCNEGRFKRADILDMNYLLTKLENVFWQLDPNVEMKQE